MKMPVNWRSQPAPVPPIAWTALAAALLFAGSSIFAATERQETPLATAGAGPGGARNLTLAPNLSFTDDSSSNFPIRGENLEDGKIASDRPTAIFFGTSHCWNTNREAERFVALSAKEKDAVRFLVVDLDARVPRRLGQGRLQPVGGDRKPPQRPFRPRGDLEEVES
jgi:hypothetical protein